MGDPWVRKRSSNLRSYHTNYKHETWTKLLQCLSHEGLSANGKVMKPVLKERFKSFNAMLDEIHRTQTTWVVSDKQLHIGYSDPILSVVYAEVQLGVYSKNRPESRLAEKKRKIYEMCSIIPRPRQRKFNDLQLRGKERMSKMLSSDAAYSNGDVDIVSKEMVTYLQCVLYAIIIIIIIIKKKTNKDGGDEFNNVKTDGGLLKKMCDRKTKSVFIEEKNVFVKEKRMFLSKRKNVSSKRNNVFVEEKRMLPSKKMNISSKRKNVFVEEKRMLSSKIK
uniref:Exocyst subunit Exo70 family protein n=1 Tax=Tanacetum cinerariifolium TaxID=118510 RepID=A0A6L2JYP5_TANCI|nr:exocyst complex component EXO70B1 [Tanacetum cinerariifolium]